MNVIPICALITALIVLNVINLFVMNAYAVKKQTSAVAIVMMITPQNVTGNTVKQSVNVVVVIVSVQLTN